MNGGDGGDTASYSTSTSAVTVNLLSEQHAGDASGDIFNGIEVFTGNDILTGNEGQDVLNGGTGADILTGGAGSDVLNGGANWDTFVFENASSSTPEGGIDLVADFSQLEGDIIDLSGMSASFRIFF